MPQPQPFQNRLEPSTDDRHNESVIWICLWVSAIVFSSSGTVPAPRVGLPAQTNYFAATAMDAWGNESDYTDTLVLANTNRARYVTLGWDPSPSEGITNYRVYHGRVPGVWTNQVDAGTNLTATIQIMPLLLSNLVVRVTCNGSDLIFSPSLGHIQLWYSLGATTWTETNPPGIVFWRSVGHGSTVTITSWRQ